jgi:hypothetical protein
MKRSMVKVPESMMSEIREIQNKRKKEGEPSTFQAIAVEALRQFIRKEA